MTKHPYLKLTSLIMGCLLLAACDHDDDDTPEPETPVPVNYTYEVTIVNLTEAQPLSPVALALHDDMTLWQIGEMASEALEMQAEGGDNSALLADPELWVAMSGADPIGPGQSQTMMITIEDQPNSFLSVSTMLVNTNDAFAGITGMALGDMDVNASASFVLPVLDAGTEANSEMAGTIPGPADGGEGFNSERDDFDTISYHPGVVSAQDNLSTSVLMAAHRFDNPAIKLTVTRLE